MAGAILLDDIAKEIVQMSHDIAKLKSDFHLNSTHEGESSSVRSETHSFVIEEKVVGRRDDVGNIMNMLLMENSDSLSVLPIVGMGGLGKTTVAQMVFNDPWVQQHFDLRMWICVSEDFDVAKLARAILASGKGNQVDVSSSMEFLQKSLREMLSSKRYLLVLDDVWNDVDSKWEELKDLLSFGAKGSVVVTTTRNKVVGSIMGTIGPYNLSILSEEECWDLFRQRAFPGGREEDPELVEIGKRIVNKLGGLPQAVKTVGSLMRRLKKEKSDWLAILNSELWDIPAGKDKYSVETLSFLVCPFTEIEAATNGFSESSMIGKGGYGSVYKGKLRGTIVAIKMLASHSRQSRQEFFQELDVLCQMKHQNLVNLIGACFECYALVYEFLPNGSLEDCLIKRSGLLTWKIRTRIIFDICSSLKFLHSRSVVHGDIKPHNILLDASFNGKLADFGLCRFLPEGTTSGAFLATSPKGTFEYIDLKFLETGILRPSSDLYSFGVTILKLVTGQKPLGLSRRVSDAYENTIDFGKMIDATAGSWPFELAHHLAYWGLQCCYHNEKSSQLMDDMWTCLEEMLAEIAELQ